VKKIIVSERIWRETWDGLRSRGRGIRESACVWGGQRSEKMDVVNSVIFLDDLHGVSAGARYHRMSRDSILALFKILKSNKQVIIADIHTHPSSWVDLSLTDRESPIEYRPGLPAMVLPHYACTAPDLKTIGLHEYKGDGLWEQFEIENISTVVKIMEA